MTSLKERKPEFPCQAVPKSCSEDSKMPDRCVVFGCSNRAIAEKGISLHRIPFWNDERPKLAKRRRMMWVNFVAEKRAKWTPSKFPALCLQHFNAEDYEKYIVDIPGTRDYTP